MDDKVIKAGLELTSILINYCSKNAGNSELLQDYINEIKTGTGVFTNQQESMQRLTETGERIAANAQKLSESYNKNSDSVEHIFSTFNDLSSQVSEIDVALKAAGKSLSGLSEQVNTITKHTDMIEEISEQTNLLSFNASIEAARAGNAGKGFRIIANEVKKLSEHTKSTSQEIAKMVGELSDKIIVLQQEQNRRNEMLKNLIKISEESKNALISMKENEQFNSENAKQVIELIAENKENIDKTVAAITENESNSANRIQVFADKTSESAILFNDLISFVIELNHIFKYLSDAEDAELESL